MPRLGESHPDSARSLKRVSVELVAASFVVLFQELALIRGVPGQVRVLGYFPNLILISAFLGLGVGALRGDRRSILWMWPPSLLLLVVTTSLLSRVAFTANDVSEHLWLLYFDLPEGAPVFEGVRLPIAVLFSLSALTFVPLGQAIAERLNVFRRESAALWGYSLDLTGSLFGVALFSTMSFLGTTPTAWYAVVFLAAAPLFVRLPRLRWGYVVMGALVLITLSLTDRAERYSPYYALSTSSPGGYDESTGFQVLTNGSLHQMAWSMARGTPAISQGQERHREGLHLPADLLQETPRRALVLGAGTGNDVAVLLDHGVEHVDAVEIDPVILELGRERHPDRPYDSPRVTVFTTDARSFLNNTQEQYDLIVLGTLDSMTRLSALSAVRLDNFVYTVEALEAARDHLSPNGGMALSFWVGYDYIHQHLRAMLTEAFGKPPAFITNDFTMLNAIYLAGPGFDHVQPNRETTSASELRLPSDNWPYLYLPSPNIGSVYISLIGILLGLSIVAVISSSTEMRAGLRGRREADPEMFLYGFAFLLMETRFVTEMNLLWGATWLTSAVVFGSILAIILAGTVMVQLKPVSYRVAFVGLIAAMLVTYLIPVEGLLTPDRGLRLLRSAAYIGLPVLFASWCFALRFKERRSPDLAFGWNLLGAVAGGLAEMLSMMWGLKALLLVAAGAYLLSPLANRITQSAQPDAPGITPGDDPALGFPESPAAS